MYTWKKIISRISKPLILLVSIILVSAKILGDIESIEYGESVYRTFLLVSTVSEYPAKTLPGKIFSGIVVITGLGILFYLVTVISRVLLEIDIRKVFRKRKSKTRTFL